MSKKDKDTRSGINAAAAKAADKDIHSSSIPNEIKLMVQLANSCEIVVQDVFNRIKGIYAKHGFRPTNDNEILKGLTDYCKCVRAAGWHFYNKIDPLIADATFFQGDEIDDGMTGSQRYDAFNGAANIGVRLLMLYADRVANDETYSKLFRTLRNMPTRGIFSDEDIARFTNKGKR
jgi:hypothetical protein